MSPTADRHPFTPDSFAHGRHIIDGTLALDGHCAVVALVSVERPPPANDELARTSLWHVDLRAGRARPLTIATTNASSPRCSPDGRWLYFLSARDAQGRDMQVHRLPMDGGGEAQAVTRIVGGVAAFSLRPDGAKLLCVASGEEPKLRGPRDHLRVRRLMARLDGLPMPLEDAFQALFVVDLDVDVGSGDAERVAERDGLIPAAHWSPCGTRIAFLRLMGKNNDRPNFADLCCVDADGRERILVAHGQLQQPFWSADGTLVGFSRPPGDDYLCQPQLFVVPADGGTPVSRTSTTDRPVPALLQFNSPSARGSQGPRAIDDGALAVLGEGGEGRLVRIALSGPQRCEPVLAGPRICRLLDLRDGRMLFTAQDLNTPARLCMADANGGHERIVCDFNASWHGSVAWPSIERIEATPAGGVAVEAWMLLPAHRTSPHKTLVYAHGGPHAAWGHGFSEDVHELVGAGYAVILVNNRGSSGYGDAFQGATGGRWGEPEFDDFEAVVDAAVERGLADPARLGLLGVSGGGHLAAWLITHTQRYAAAVPEQGVYQMTSMYGVSDAGPLLVGSEMGGTPRECEQRYRDLSPVTHAHRCVTPTLLIQGEDDLRCPMEQAEQMFVALKLAGCEVELLRLRCSHGAQLVGTPPLRRYRMDAIRDWFARHIPDASPQT